MGEKRYIIITKQCEVAGKLSILDGCLKKSYSSVYDLGKRFLGHPSCIDDFPCNLTQFCYTIKLDKTNREGSTRSGINPSVRSDPSAGPEGLPEGLDRHEC